jgi:hypothetical protein
MRSPQREIRLAALAPDPGAGLWYSQKTRRKQPPVFEKDPWLALQRRIRGLLGVDFHARALSAILDLAFDRLETEPDAGNQQKVIALASLLIQLEAAELRPDAAKPGAALPQLIERERTRRRAEALAAAEALRGPRIIVAKPTLAEPPPIPTANGSEISPGPETDYITYWDARARGPAGIAQYQRQGSRSLLDLQQTIRHAWNQGLYSARLRSDPGIDPCLASSLLEVHCDEHYYRLPGRFHLDRFFGRKLEPLSPPIHLVQHET